SSRQAVRACHDSRASRARADRRSSFGQTAGAVVCRRRMGGRRGPALSPAVDLAAGLDTAERCMERPLTTPRFLAGLLAPGGVLVFAAWAVQREEVVRSAAAPYAPYFCFGALVAGVLLSWYYDQSRLLCSASAVVLTVLALGPLATDSSLVKLA